MFDKIKILAILAFGVISIGATGQAAVDCAGERKTCEELNPGNENWFIECNRRYNSCLRINKNT